MPMYPVLDADAEQCLKCEYVRRVYLYTEGKKYLVDCNDELMEDARKIRRVLFLINQGCNFKLSLWQDFLALQKRLCTNFGSNTCFECT